MKERDKTRLEILAWTVNTCIVVQEGRPLRHRPRIDGVCSHEELTDLKEMGARISFDGDNQRIIRGALEDHLKRSAE